MLHVVNGATTLAVIALTDLQGDAISGDDILMEGPAPGVLLSPEDWQRRADWLEARLGLDAAVYLAGVETRDTAMRHTIHHDELVAWFDRDLFSQVNLLFWLDRIWRLDPESARTSLVLPPGGHEPSLARLAPETYRHLWEHRIPIDDEALAWAAHCFTAWCAPHPSALVDFLADPPPGLASIAAALRIHLHRFPSVEDGLDDAQRTLIRLVDGVLPFPTLWDRWEQEPLQHDLGLGDRQLAHIIEGLAAGSSPHLIVSGDAGLEWCRDWSIERAPGPWVAGQPPSAGRDSWVGPTFQPALGPIWWYDPAEDALVYR